jgi:cytochrome b561
LIPRLFIRATSKIPAHIPGSTMEVLAGKASHLLLYGAIVGMPVTGVLMGYYR